MRTLLESILDKANKRKLATLGDFFSPHVEEFRRQESKDLTQLVSFTKSFPTVTNRKLINRWKKGEYFAVTEYGRMIGGETVEFWIADPGNSRCFHFDLRTDCTPIWSYCNIYPKWPGAPGWEYHVIPFEQIQSLLDVVKDNKLEFRHFDELYDIIKSKP